MTILTGVAGGAATRVRVYIAHTGGIVGAQVAYAVVHALLTVLACEAARTAAALLPACAAVVAATVAVQAIRAFGIDGGRDDLGVAVGAQPVGFALLVAVPVAVPVAVHAIVRLYAAYVAVLAVEIRRTECLTTQAVCSEKKKLIVILYT